LTGRGKKLCAKKMSSEKKRTLSGRIGAQHPQSPFQGKRKKKG